MVMANAERVSKALDLLAGGLRPKCEQTWQGFYGDDWLDLLRNQMYGGVRDGGTTADIAFVLNGMKATWNEIFGHGVSPSIRSLVFEVADTRNNWAHKQQFSTDDTARALDSMERLLEAFGITEERQQIRKSRRDLIRQMYDEEARSERRRTAAKPTEGQPQAGLTPWREVITPHSDVQTGRFNQAEFAADLYEVSQGTADHEYQEPEAFFARTYLTVGLRELLVGATQRLSGNGGTPVIELQTNFGGGKTHSMIALHHLASGVPAARLSGVSEMLAEAEVELPAKVNRAVLVGQVMSVADPKRVSDDTGLHTMWGHLAYQARRPGGLRAGTHRRRGRNQPGRETARAVPSLRPGSRADRRVGGVCPAAPRCGRRQSARGRWRLRHAIHLRPGAHRGGVCVRQRRGAGHDSRIGHRDRRAAWPHRDGTAEECR